MRDLNKLLIMLTKEEIEEDYLAMHDWKEASKKQDQEGQNHAEGS